MILYHASDVEGLTELTPQTSNHKNPYVYLSTNKESIFIYLVNPVRKFCLENNIEIEKGHTCNRLALRGWDKQKNAQRLYEYWPNAFEEIFKGTPSFFYEVEKNEDCKPLVANEFKSDSGFYVCSKPIAVKNVERISDTYKYLMQMEREGKVVLQRFENLSSEQKEFIRKNIIDSYDNAKRYKKTHFQKFLECKFDYILKPLDKRIEK